MTEPVDPQAALGELVLETPHRARLFEQLGLDYCCGGARSLAATCEQRGLDVDTVVAVIAALDADEAAAGPAEHDINRYTVGELCDHIVERHHEPLRTELPRISGLLAKVLAAHGDELPALRDIDHVYGGMRTELERHVEVEETVLFPACRELEERPGEGVVDDDLLAAHERDHDGVGAALMALRELSGGYRREAALCGTHRALIESMQGLEREIHQHVHEENNALFPRVRALIAAA